MPKPEDAPVMKEKDPLPRPIVAVIPVVVLIGFLAIAITIFGSESLSGGSPLSLLMGMAVCVCISMAFSSLYKCATEKYLFSMLAAIASLQEFNSFIKPLAK